MIILGFMFIGQISYRIKFITILKHIFLELDF